MILDKALEKWKKRLGLSDWTITAQWRDARDLQQNQARTNIQKCLQHADIRLMRVEDRQECDPGDANPELDLVHELIHVRLWAIDPEVYEGVLHDCREQAIEWIAKALVNKEADAKS
jgi:hypothetical protein